MNIKQFFVISIIAIATVISGCSNRSDIIGVREGTAIIVDASNVVDTIDIALSQWVEKLEMIQFDDSSIEAFFAYPFISISENYIGMFEELKPFKLYDRKSGKLLYTIGDIGRGPGEYWNIYSAQIDEAADRIYLLPWVINYILTYDLRGKFVGSIPLPFQSTKGHFRVDSKNKRVIVSTIPFRRTGKIVWQQDFEGTVIGGEDAASFALQSPNADNEIFRTGNTLDYDFQIMSSTPVDKIEYLYHYDIENNLLIPVFKMIVREKGRIDSGKSVFVSYTELSECFIGQVITALRTERTGWKWQRQSLFINKTNLTGAWFRLYNDFLGINNTTLSITGGYGQGGYFSGGYFIQLFDPSEFIDILKRAELKSSGERFDRLHTMRRSIKEDGNSILVFGKLK
ncbi:MAG: 6-bladed beta-propeller [Bacteroidales bacterium]|nr:6-bladed beta-propeller [Bacteroidales bacterium]